MWDNSEGKRHDITANSEMWFKYVSIQLEPIGIDKFYSIKNNFENDILILVTNGFKQNTKIC